MNSLVRNVSSAELNKISILKSLQFKDHVYTNVLPPEQANENSLVFVTSAEMVQNALKKNVRGFIVLEKAFPTVQNLFSIEHSVWTTQQINQAMSQVLTYFDRKTLAEKKGIHPTAVVSSKAKIGQNVSIGPFTVVEDYAEIHDYSIIGPHCVIETAARIGRQTRMASHVYIGSYCEIGAHCIFSSFVSIGGDGFGFFTDKSNAHHKIPQIGKVVIEDNCEIQSHCAIDRATLFETRIGKGSKLDNFCHIAHNVTIGENALITAGFIVAGSTKIGKNLITAGGVHMNGHIEVTDNTIFSGRAGVTSSVDKPGIYGGFPQMPHKDNLRVMATLIHLPQMRKQILKILKHLNLSDESSQ